jgi:hypothetical protein
MDEIDPYRMPAGPELDQLIHTRVMGLADNEHPTYSTDERAARRVLARIKAESGRTVVVGKTALRNARYFARYETDPSDGTEVLAESLPLAICRLALIHFSK